MTYATAMVVVELGRSNARLLTFAGDLATRMGLGLMGVAACQPMVGIYDQSMVLGDYVQEDRDELAAEIKAAEAEFDEVIGGRGIALNWHAMITTTSLCEYTVARARAADIILCATGGETISASRRASISDLIMHAGRPILLIPAPVEKLAFEHAVVLWKDTREARRAIADALPLLKLARQVTVVERAADTDLSDATLRLTDVVGWLSHHRISATAVPVLGSGDDTTRLARFVKETGADLSVSGAYGHSRKSEWLWGGVTRDLLLAPSQCALLSH